VPPPRPSAGQASAEYVALLAVVCAVVAGVAAVGSAPPIAAQVAGAIKHGICLVAGGICTPREARAAGLAPCLVHARSDRERLGGRVMIVKVGRGDSLLVQRRSDGTASVSFADGEVLGGSLGVALQVGGQGLKARGGVGLQFTAGRTWEFPDAAAAARFVHRWARTETMTGELKGLLPGGEDPPPPDVTYKELGSYGEIAGSMGIRNRVSVSESADLGQVAGRRIGRDGRVTYYVRVDGETAGKLGAVVGSVQAHSAGQAVLEITALHGRAVELRVLAAARVHSQLSPAGPVSSLADLATRLRGSRPQPGGVGRRLEAEVALDLTKPENRAALRGVLEIPAARVKPWDWDDRIRALAQRIDADGAVDVRLFRDRLEQSDVGADLGLGATGFGGGYDRTEEVRDLIGAWSLRAGGSLQEREDCIPA
jgi:hypothetical protein